MSHMRGGRPREFDEEQALDGAMRVFWTRGAQATTTRDLEGALGLGPSSLYNAFGSKQALLARSLARYHAIADAGLLEPMRTAPDGLAAVAGFLARLEDWLLADGGRGCMVGRLMAETPPSDEVAAGLAAYRDDLRAAIAAALGRAAAAGEIARDSVDGRVEVVFGMVLGLNLALRAGLPHDEIRGLAAADRAEVLRWGSSPGTMAGAPAPWQGGPA